MFEKNITNRQLGIFSVVLVTNNLIVGILAIYFSVYPGGYSIQSEDTEKVVVIKKDNFQEEQFVYPVTKENELKIALLKYEIKQLNSMWLISLMGITALLIFLAINLQSKVKNMIILITAILVLLVPMAIYVYMVKLNSVDQLLNVIII